MQITFDSNKDDLTAVIKLTKFLQNYKLEQKPATDISVNIVNNSEETATVGSLSETPAVSSEAFGAPKKRGPKPKAKTDAPEVKQDTPIETAIAAATTPAPVEQAPAPVAPSVFETAAPAPVQQAYTAQQFYQVIVDLNKAGTFNPNTDMEGFCGEVSAFAGKTVKNIVEITGDPGVIQVAFQVLKNHGLI